ncbi:M42 family metallopeptidase [Halobaculum magnesiiphilum]|uniref:M42 family metallopeptidase n=1 Tax=Halobaculum magnesiiphilum TaxID=1017351 RepID=A0A8T8WDB6_9EURY|nr:M42 family metallopeptidase [Halobaculum magnesiiphilum]QZP37830.1 M42 family metallopeptidase [Halobaculum magnesiiphilum]
MNGFDLLRDLTESHGPVGYETEPREIVVREFERAVDRVRTDAMGNVVGTVEGDPEEPELLIAAHMDEIGFMVRHVDDDGFVRVSPLGGWNPEILRSARVRVHADDGADPVDGVIGAIPAHVRDTESEQDVEDIAIDVGLDGEASRERIAVGDVVTMRAATERIGECVSGKALDDRAGVWAMLRAAARADPDATVHYVATTQEEVGLRGAEGVGVDLDPDVAIAVDGTLERGVPGVDAADRVTTLGDGVAVKRKDATVVPTPAVVRRLEALAEEREIPYQREVAANIGTDTGALQTAAGSTPVGAVSIPVRYHHSTVETAHVDDLTATVDLLTAAVEAAPDGLR